MTYYAIDGKQYKLCCSTLKAIFLAVLFRTAWGRQLQQYSSLFAYRAGALVSAPSTAVLTQQEDYKFEGITKPPGVWHLSDVFGKEYQGKGEIYIPKRNGTTPLPCMVYLHSAGKEVLQDLKELNLLEFAEDYGILLLAPTSTEGTWDLLMGSLGPDVAFLDVLLSTSIPKIPIDFSRFAIAGFSDGATEALQLGVINGQNMFSHVITHSPGGYEPSTFARGYPKIFVSYGLKDKIFPPPHVKQIIKDLKKAGYNVTARAHSEGHNVPRAVVQDSMDWLFAS